MISAILEARRLANEAARRVSPVEEMREAAIAASSAIAARPFKDALTVPGMSLIAELKKASPSKGILREDFPVDELAKEYEEGGASALSVLTEPLKFLGEYDYLSQAKAATNLPCLQKDFILDEYQLYEGRLAGSDAALLIVNLLSDAELTHLMAVARDIGVATLVEVHNEEELERALAAGSEIIGINHRDLWTFEMDMSAAERLAPRAKADGAVVVAESGISNREDVLRMEAAGADAVLVGESIVRSGSVGDQIRLLLGL